MQQDDAVRAGQAPVIPDPALVVLIGPAGSGKSTWAAAHYRQAEIVSADQLRSVVGSGEADLDASADAFALLDQIAAARTGRRLTTVLDTLGLDPGRRRQYLVLASRAGLPAVAVLLRTDAAVCKERNRRRARPVPAPVLTSQLRRMSQVTAELAAENWDLILTAADALVEPAHSPGARAAAAGQQASRPGAGQQARRAASQPDGPTSTASQPAPAGLDFVLQVSRFGWGDDPASWLSSVALAADEAGFTGLALMDHLIQIPQVGRAWENIPEPWVTLGLLAGLRTKLRLGTLVSPVTFRPPGIIAKTAATLDVLCGGRAFCGIGAGWWDREHAAFGIPFPPPAQRLDQLETAIETMRALWGAGTKPYDGQRISLPETTCYPRPASQIPIIVGSGGDRTLRIAARLADGCNLPSLAGLDAKLAALRTYCEQAGRDPAELMISVLDVPVIGTDRDHAADLVERLRGRTAATAYARQHHAGGTDDHIGRYRLLADRGVRTVFVALPDLAGPDDVLRAAPVIAAFS